MIAVRIFQKGWNQGQDGPGNRLVYHLQGCNLACPWCANPEGIPAGGSLMTRREQLVPEVCPHGAICDQAVDRRRCKTCRAKECVTENPNQGIRLSCSEYPVPELMDEVRGCKALFHSGGGVTLSGGEPTLQFEAVRAFLKRLKADGVNTALETNGTHPDLSELFPLIDTLIFDLKHYDAARMKETVGRGNKTVLENLRRAAASHRCVWLRITLVPGFNASAADVVRFVEMIRRLPQEHLSVELLSYHEFGKVKWEQCGLPYRMKSAGGRPYNKEKYEALFRRAGINVIRT